MHEPPTNSPPTTTRPSALGRFLRAFDPDELLGAVFQREIRASARRAMVILARGAYILLLAGAAWIAYAAFNDDLNSGGSFSGPTARLQGMQRLAPILTIVVVATQGVLLTLIAPSTTAGALCEERKKRTLDVLLTTPLRPFQIVFGKLAAGLVNLFILCLASLPILLAVRVFGGVDARWILCATAITLCTAVAGASIALMCSVFAKRAASASFLAIMMLAATVIIPVVIVYIQGPRAGPTGGMLDLFTCASPFAMVAVCTQMMDFTIPFIDPLRATKFTCGYNLGIALLALTIATTLLRRVMLATGAGSAPAVTETVEEVTEEFIAAAPAEGELAEGEEALPRRVRRTVRVARGVSREVADQPVLWRELRQPLFRRRWVFFLTLTVLVLLVLWMFAKARSTDDVPFYFIGAVLLIVFAFQATPFACNSIIGERESQTFDVLLTTPLTPRQIILGKYLGCLRRLYLMPAMLLGVYVVFGVATGRLHGIILLHTVLIFAIAGVFLAATGVSFSLRCKRSSVAATFNTTAGLAVWAILPLMIGLTGVILEANGKRNVLLAERERLMDGALLLNPFYLLPLAIDGASRRSSAFIQSTPSGFGGTYQLAGSQTRFDTAQFTLALFIVLGLACAAAALILWRAMVVFNRRTGRSS